jgi:hypothetical protein
MSCLCRRWLGNAFLSTLNAFRCIEVLSRCRLNESASRVKIALVTQVRSGLLLGADHLVGGSSRRPPSR